MKKFIDREMEKRRGKTDDDDETGGKGSYVAPEDKALMSLPDHLKKSTFKKNEEMLSSQMLSGIPEVDLGIEEKIRNIEATEEAKKRLADARARALRSQNQTTDFAPTNLAVNFKHPNRFKSDVEEEVALSHKKMRFHIPEPQQQQQQPAAGSVDVITHRTVKVGDLPEEKVIAVGVGGAEGSAGGAARKDVIRPSGGGDKATDDLYLTKFKSHFHRK